MSDPSLWAMASLAVGEKHGYAIMIDVERFAGVKLSPGTLYGAITRLKERGSITGVESEDRRPYRLTGEGRAQLADQVAGLERVAKTAARRLKQA